MVRTARPAEAHRRADPGSSSLPPLLSGRRKKRRFGPGVRPAKHRPRRRHLGFAVAATGRGASALPLADDLRPGGLPSLERPDPNRGPRRGGGGGKGAHKRRRRGGRRRTRPERGPSGALSLKPLLRAAEASPRRRARRRLGRDLPSSSRWSSQASCQSDRAPDGLLVLRLVVGVEKMTGGPCVAFCSSPPVVPSFGGLSSVSVSADVEEPRLDDLETYWVGPAPAARGSPPSSGTDRVPSPARASAP
jgi:hypothetical protein